VEGTPEIRGRSLASDAGREPQRLAEAVRRALLRLQRYEARAETAPSARLQGEHLLNKHLKIVTGRIFAKRTQFVVGFSGAYPLRVATCLQPTRPKLTDLTRDTNRRE
jgi:hypothetical protein